MSHSTQRQQPASRPRDIVPYIYKFNKTGYFSTVRTQLKRKAQTSSSLSPTGNMKRFWISETNAKYSSLNQHSFSKTIWLTLFFSSLSFSFALFSSCLRRASSVFAFSNSL